MTETDKTGTTQTLTLQTRQSNNKYVTQFTSV